MSRTRKGSKAPGWEPWSNIREREVETALSKLRDWHMRYLDAHVEHEHALDLEHQEALACEAFGPCNACLTHDAERGEADCD